jgi:cytochrome c oxidase subunit IV
MSDHHNHHDHDDHDHEMHITPVRTYLIAAAALFVLTVITVAVAFFDFGPLNEVIAMGVATAKAAVIIVVFMHARYTTGVTRLAMVAGIVWFAILVLGVMDDYLTRSWTFAGW